jgi:iron complex outermembrane receptor protein
VQTTVDGLRSWALRSQTVAAVVFCFTLGAAASSVHAAGAAAATVTTDASTTNNKKKEDTLEEVVVTGSLIPQSKVEISTPVTVISAEDIQDKGFSTIADALQHTAFATGAIQGAQSTNGFTPGANVVSLFGLSPSYTKYLIDGRPLADYPALYNGSVAITSISGIPTLLVDRVEILPGAQSSIYGSDAIAGVINIILKKKMDGPSADVRYGWTKGGGGTDKRLELADGFTAGGVDVIVGGQYEKTTPIWGYQRPITSQYFANGPTPQTAERDYLVLGVFGPNGDGSDAYYFEDPTNCASVTGQFNNTIALQSRPGRGQYCGTKAAGFYTLNNGTEATQGYVHASDDINDHFQLFSDVLIDHDYAKYSNGPGFWATNVTNTYNDFYDPKLNDYITLQHIFSPEEAGGLNNTLNKNTTNSIRATIGAKGALVSDWTYAVDFTYTQNKLTESLYTSLTAPIEALFAPMFGPNLGPDPNGFGVPSYEPNYAAFYKPLTPAQWASFSTPLNSYSRTEESLARLQVTNASLFKLPGGDAGIALVVDGGAQGWDYQPDPNFLDGGAYLYTATSGSGHRSRYSGTAEVRLPVAKMLTFNLSGRYDDYKVLGESVDKATYNLGVEFRPISQLMLRGRYGTAFKAPTLADEFQGTSGFFEFVTDYYQCAKQGFTGTNVGNCPLASAVQVFGTTSGTPTLKPITAKVLDFGLVLTPVDRLDFTVDFIRWNISNEIQEQPSDQLLRTEAACRLGELSITSPTCVQALSQVTRDQFGNLTQISTPKVNVSEEDLNVFTVALDYTVMAGAAGSFTFEGQYSDTLKHNFTQFVGDQVINDLENPFFNEDFKTRANVSVTWLFRKFSSTVYVERDGATPNYVAYQSPSGYATPGAGRVGTWTLANLSAKYEILPGLTLSGNVINVFDKMPPPDNSTPGTVNQPYLNTNYNPYGRTFFVEANYKFGK